MPIASLSDITLGRYYTAESILHRLDPRTKLISTILLMLAVFAISRVFLMVLFLLLVIALYPLAHLHFKVFWGNLRAFFWLYAITFSIHLFFHQGNVLVSLPLVDWGITLEGIAAGFLFTIRIAVLVSLSTLLMSVTTPQEITDGIERMLRPLNRLKVPVSEGALMVSITLRFVPILMREAFKIRNAQVSRGANLEGSWIVRIKKSLPMILPLFAGALKRADDLALALDARAYRGGRGRTQLIALKVKANDVAALAVTLSFTLGFLILQ